MKQWDKVPVISEKIKRLNPPAENKKIFIFYPVIRPRNGGTVPEKSIGKNFGKSKKSMQRKSEVIPEGMIPYCRIRKIWGFIRVMLLRFPGFYFYRKKYRKMFHVKQRGKWPTVSEKIAGLDSRKKILQETGIIEIQQLWQKRERSRSRFRKVF